MVESQLPQKTVQVELSPKGYELFDGNYRMRVAYGGRGGAKSWDFARHCLIQAASRNCRILCGRETQVSIKDSVLRLLIDQIELLGLQDYFEYGESFLRAPYTGAQFIFKGLRSNKGEIKSMEKIDIAWIEEAHGVSEESWRLLTPTIRAPGSEILISFNPDEATDPTYVRYVENPPSFAKVVKINYMDNPWFPEELELERAHLQEVDPDAYDHVWLGNCRKNSAAQIMKGKYKISDFEAPIEDDNWTVDGPYFGGDWGFANDPAACVKMWITTKKNTNSKAPPVQELWIEHEYFGVGIDTDLLVDKFEDGCPDVKEHVLRCDSSRPETISYFRKSGYPHITKARKWEGCVEDGIAFLRRFRTIHIHRRCENMQFEAQYYRYKTDRLTEDVLPIIADKHNHGWDAVRYGLDPLIKKRDDTAKSSVAAAPESSGNSFFTNAVVA